MLEIELDDGRSIGALVAQCQGSEIQPSGEGPGWNLYAALLLKRKTGPHKVGAKDRTESWRGAFVCDSVLRLTRD
jgi:hypothetical protein